MGIAIITIIIIVILVVITILNKIITLIIIGIVIVIVIVYNHNDKGRLHRCRRSHAGNRHLGNHRGCSVAFSNGLSAACSDGSSFVSDMFQRIVTFPVDFD